MSLSEIIIGGIIGGGVVSIISAVLQHYSNKKLNRFEVVNESQFKTFNELWKSLTDLKFKANNLWDNANDVTLLSFVNSLKDASDTLEANALILNEVDYNNLKNILNKFSDYQIGKTRLIDMDKGKIKAEIKTFTTLHGAMTISDDRLNQVFQNENSKKEYEKLLGELRIKFQDKMGIK